MSTSTSDAEVKAAAATLPAQDAMIEVMITPDSNFSTVAINGQVIERVSRIEIEAAVNETSTVLLTLVGYRVELHGQIGEADFIYEVDPAAIASTPDPERGA